MRTCPYCETEFEPTVHNQRFCSYSCRDAFYQERRAEMIPSSDRNRHSTQRDTDLMQAEADVENLILRAEQALPVLLRCVEDVEDWRKDIRATILKNLTETIETVKGHQQERKAHRT